MPLEINEIGISMRVTSDREDTGGRRNAHEDADEAREELIEECIRRVLQALKIERER
jgi:hypothetical protein